VTAWAEEKQKSVRRLASEILLRVDTRKAYADILLDHALNRSGLDTRDQALLTEVVYGTLRWRGTIDARLSLHMGRPLSEADPLLRNLLRATLYQIIFLDKIPAYAAVNEAVEIAKSRGAKAAGFVNAVLRSFLRHDSQTAEAAPRDQAPDALAEEFSHPRWLVKLWLADFGADGAKSLMRANNERAPLAVRANSLIGAREALLELFRTAGVDAEPTRWSPQGILILSGPPVRELPGFSEGFFQVQGEASQLVTYLLDPRPGERILDACAAPGGKSTHIAEMMRDEGEVIALDASATGLDRIRENAARLQLKCVHAVRGDASRKLDPSLDALYDRILVDAPCSGLGTLRSHPEIKWRLGESDIRRLCKLQSKILGNVAAHLKPGGALVYSTCTLTRAENDRTVDGFLRAHTEFELEDVARYLPQEARHMARARYFQAVPHRDGTDGFFAARMRKVS
jgi:16S rRNA (cytosine967-C5)-methyltransferase